MGTGHRNERGTGINHLNFANMPIIVNLDVMMAKRKISLGELAEKMDITPPTSPSSRPKQSQSNTFLHSDEHLLYS